MTIPRQSAGTPPLEDIAQDVLGAVRPRQRPVLPMTAAEKAEAEQAEQKTPPCHLCLCYHALPGSPGCPRLTSFRTDGDGLKVLEGTFRTDRKWMDRVVPVEDLRESGDDG